MGEVEQFDRNERSAPEEIRPLMGRNGGLRNDSARPDLNSPQPLRDPQPRAVGSPLPTGRPAAQASSVEGLSGRPGVPPPGRSLSVSAQADAEQSSGMQWALGVMKQAVPFVQKLLPLLDGQVATAVANLIATRPHTPPPAPRVDLQPLENGLSDLQLQQRGLREQLTDQNTALKRVEDHLEMVREATDRNTLEQQELIEDLKTMGNRVNLLALLFLALLLISVLLNIFLFLHIQRVLP